MRVNVELPSILRHQEVCFVQLSMAQSPGPKHKATSVLCLSPLHPGPVPPAHFKTKLSNLDLSLMPSGVRLQWTMTPIPTLSGHQIISVDMFRTFRLIDLSSEMFRTLLVTTSGVSPPDRCKTLVAKHPASLTPASSGSSSAGCVVTGGLKAAI